MTAIDPREEAEVPVPNWTPEEGWTNRRHFPPNPKKEPKKPTISPYSGENVTTKDPPVRLWPWGIAALEYWPQELKFLLGLAIIGAFAILGGIIAAFTNALVGIVCFVLATILIVSYDLMIESEDIRQKEEEDRLVQKQKVKEVRLVVQARQDIWQKEEEARSTPEAISLQRIIDDPHVPSDLRREARNKLSMATHKIDSRTIPTYVKRQVYARDGGKCVQCGSIKKLHYDHDIPFSKGGSNTVDNIRLLCQKCNLSKRDKII